jgi:small ligand-binding sensory domain FIST
VPGAATFGTARHFIRRYLGPIPIAGFFTGFEIGALGENTSLLQYSGVLALISNKKS